MTIQMALFASECQTWGSLNISRKLARPTNGCLFAIPFQLVIAR